MADTLEFELVAPERLIFSGSVEMVVIPGAEGDFGVLPGHALLMSTVRPGTIDIYEDDKIKTRYLVADGFAEVTGERCTVLSTEAYDLAEIDRADAQKRLEAAQLDLRDASSDEEREKAEHAVAVAELMVEATA